MVGVTTESNHLLFEWIFTNTNRLQQHPQILGRYSPTILKNGLRIVLQVLLYLEAFDCNTTSDWLNYTV